MNGEAKYVIDADTLIESAKNFYAFDIAPAFWEQLVRLAAQRRIVSIDRIKEEILRGNDELATWIANGNLGDAFQDSRQEDIIRAYAEVMTWTEANPVYTRAAKDEFAEEPDGWLVAYAKAKGCIVVTFEKSQPLRQNRVKIPDVCNGVGVQSMNIYEMLRALGVRFST